jgi:TM2 domain-containing membrane protein YozV
MKTLLGTVLLIIGILTLAYQGFTYTKQEKIAQVGDVKISADSQKTVYFPPLLGGVSLVAGIALLVMGRNNR